MGVSGGYARSGVGTEVVPLGPENAHWYSDLLASWAAKQDRCGFHADAITRPALAEGRLSLTPQGRVRYTLKTPYRDGTTHVVFAPLDFIARLAALVPKPRVHLTRYHGVFARHSDWRAQITPAGRGSGAKAMDTRTPAERHRAMSWAQRLKRVFKLDLSSCEGCGGQVRVIACVEDPLVIGKILEHLERTGPGTTGAGRRPEVRGPPQGALELG